MNTDSQNKKSYTTPLIILGVTVLIIFFLALLVVGFAAIIGDSSSSGDDWYAEDTYSNLSSCNTMKVQVHGAIATSYTQIINSLEEGEEIMYTTTDEVAYYVDQITENSNIEAILLDIESAGGSPTAAEEIVTALHSTNLPIAAVIRNQGLSAGYYIATAADVIYASRYSDVGSIGVTFSYLDTVAYNEKEGFRFNEFTSGKFKESGSINKTLTAEESAYFQRQVDQMHEYFVSDVAQHRGIDRNDVAAIAHGGGLLGEEALEHKLIDGIGSYREAEAYLGGKIRGAVEYCE